MLIDTTVIASHRANLQAQLHVLAQQYPVVFGDGSELVLHPVRLNDTLDKFLRAVQTEGLQWTVFDVRALSASIERDILSAHWHDEPGIVYYTLRLGYRSAAQFLGRVADCRAAHWWRDCTAVPA